jgi:hypothetical protein
MGRGNKNVRWSQVDIDFLFEFYPRRAVSAKQLEEIMGRPYREIQAKARVMGIRWVRHYQTDRHVSRYGGDRHVNRGKTTTARTTQTTPTPPKEGNCTPTPKGSRLRKLKVATFTEQVEAKEKAVALLERVRQTEQATAKKAVRLDAKTVIFVPVDADAEEAVADYRYRLERSRNKEFKSRIRVN